MTEIEKTASYLQNDFGILNDPKIDLTTNLDTVCFMLLGM